MTAGVIAVWGPVDSTIRSAAMMFYSVTFRPFGTIRVVISMFCFILRLKLTSASSGMASFSSFVNSLLDGKLARSFTINSDSRFRVLRSLGVPVSRYIGDRHVGQLFIPPLRVSRSPYLERAQAATYIMCYPLIEAGYFIGIEKSQLVPST